MSGGSWGFLFISLLFLSIVPADIAVAAETVSSKKTVPQIQCRDPKFYYGCTSLLMVYAEGDDGTPSAEDHNHELALECTDGCETKYLRYFSLVGSHIGDSKRQKLRLVAGSFFRDGSGIQTLKQSSDNKAEREQFKERMTAAEQCAYASVGNLTQALQEISGVLSDYENTYAAQQEIIDASISGYWNWGRWSFEVGDLAELDQQAREVLQVLKVVPLPDLAHKAKVIQEAYSKIRELGELQQMSLEQKQSGKTKERGADLCLGENVQAEDILDNEVLTLSFAEMDQKVKQIGSEKSFMEKILFEHERRKYDEENRYSKVMRMYEDNERLMTEYPLLKRSLTEAPKSVKRQMNCRTPEEKAAEQKTAPASGPPPPRITHITTAKGTPSIIGFTDVPTSEGMVRAVWAKDYAKTKLNELSKTQASDDFQRTLSVAAIEIEPAMLKKPKQTQQAIAAAVVQNEILKQYVQFSTKTCRFESTIRDNTRLTDESSSNQMPEVLLVIKKTEDASSYSPVEITCEP